MIEKVKRHYTTELEQAILAALKKSIPATIKDAIDDIIDNAVFKRDEFTEVLSDYFNDAMRGSDCYLSFEDGRPCVIAGFGDPLYNCSFNFAVTIHYEAEHPSSEEQRGELLRQLSGIDAFIAELQAARTEIAKALGEERP